MRRRIRFPTERTSKSTIRRSSGSTNSTASFRAASTSITFGNDVRFHEKIYRIAQRVPGIAILHDTRLHHFIFESDRPNWTRYVRLVAELYGERGARIARRIVASNGSLIDAHVEEMPFVEPFLANAIGAICHSKSACADVKQRSAIPTLQLPLPFMSLAQTPRVERVWSSPFRLIMFGYIGSNRRLEEILVALKEVCAEIDFRLDVYGILQHKAEIENLIRCAGLTNSSCLARLCFRTGPR